MDLPTGIQRAYSVLHVKALDADARTITGLATSPEPDRMNDVVEPLGVTFKNPVSLLLHHDKTRPVGTVRFDKPSKTGVTFTATLPTIDEPGTLKDRVDEAWQSIKAGLIRGVSIGFRPLNDAIDFMQDTGGFRFRETELLELSLVSVPAHQLATIQTIKSLDVDRPAQTGSPVVHVRSTNQPADVGRGTDRKAAMAKTYGEQIKESENSRSVKAARMTEIMTKAADAGVTLDESQAEEYDNLKAEIKSIDEHLVRLGDMEKLNVAQAKSVEAKSIEEGSRMRDGASTVVSVKDANLPPGIGFARGVKARIVARLDGRNPLEVAKEMYPSDMRLQAHLQHESNVRNILMQMKAAVPAATTTVTAWAGALIDPTNLAGEFIEFLRPATIIGRLRLRNIPTNVRLIEQTQGGTGYWVGQGAPKPLTAFGFAPVTLSPTKVAAIAVATEESLRFSTPSLDMLIRDGLRNALVERVDRDLLDPAEAGTANVQPASLTSGLVPATSAGTSADNIRTDIGNLVQTLRSSNLRGPIAIVLPDSLLTVMAWMVNALGQPEFPGLTGEGGTFNGIRFVGSEYVANQSGSGNMVVAIAENEVFQSDDGGVRVDASDQASLQMLDNPTNNSASATPTTMVSMWQTNSVAFRGEWFINWQKRRADAVAYIDDVNWGSVGSP